MMIAQFQVSELAGFLKYGISGLSAIAFILSFYLLSRESSRAKPRAEMLRSIRMFMGLTLVLGLVSGVAGILNPTVPEPKTEKVPSKKASFVKKITAPHQIWSIEVFYEANAKALAKELAEELNNYKDYAVKMTLLTDSRKKELKISRSQIRYELVEKQAAGQLQKRLSNVLPQDVTLALKQITSSSPDYLSIFVCD
ncbi:hypothetical protein [Runella slithyformis]|uniref:Uncharacterized protein n=1 Tax=Runella slithyformis (strain ATCC 29530 / DSM 19594 / LMG 11500 / NCIMB 11436 / LSU 4) TaxID=761193 RepID=A0A7U4E5U3_RUNSL|nr:hypothetical protein [Runella slithyformis]AEI48828.1 hypothetical protein Runsl_2420 [Runella slithyformis DSM 19594]